MIENTGWTFPVVDEMDLEQLGELFEHWSEEPPLSVVVRAFAGVETKEATPDVGGEVWTEDQFRQFQAAASSANATQIRK